MEFHNLSSLLKDLYVIIESLIVVHTNVCFYCDFKFYLITRKSTNWDTMSIKRYFIESYKVFYRKKMNKLIVSKII